ncbi:sigma factor [Amycolatopsis jejuensis]|uniref:sigma factor n=1 Tax=Amycolatopsis jejuensis TaxID=330084 RepID=UPI000523F497|nr:sigma factor [Amycolatopsis jejuensis]
MQPRLFGIAYRMLGSAIDAEDLLQDVWLRWQACDRSAVENPGAYLATTTTRLAINAGQTARVRHETYAGPRLPEPIDTSAGGAVHQGRRELLRQRRSGPGLAHSGVRRGDGREVRSPTGPAPRR